MSMTYKLSDNGEASTYFSFYKVNFMQVSCFFHSLFFSIRKWKIDISQNSWEEQRNSMYNMIVIYSWEVVSAI